MDQRNFEFLGKFLKARSGLVLTPDKGYLIETRLLPVARRHGIDTIDNLIKRLKESGDEIFAVEITEAMTTNESLFFRDGTPFSIFSEKILPEIINRRSNNKKFRIWCSACSTGQEPYSLSMLISDKKNELSSWQYEILATDISHDILKKAKKGSFSQLETQRGLPIERLLKYFTQNGEGWDLNKDIIDIVKFKYFNLLDDIKSLGKFDVVFCRNVLIYFDVETKKRVLENIGSILTPDGVVFLGGSESTIGICDDFAPVPGSHGAYRLVKCDDSLAG
ncbi:MAG: protein-glutamate O-methyltransferase CheR [Rhodospirillaceae bacterium]|nr:protein-glutamate O-methyltransferase CheR [Rhodospirillaceae bacterium]